MLQRHPNQAIQVLIVWEPILMTDWGRPGAAALKRIPDPRVRQFWDPRHVVAAALRRAGKGKTPSPEPECCMAKGFYWDDAILYAKGAKWGDQPDAKFWNGPVFRVEPELEKTLSQLP